jgi:large repetitive protein
MELRLNQTAGVETESDEGAGNAHAVAKSSRPASIQTVGVPGAIPAGATQLVPVDGVVRLPEGTRLDAIRISGPNLIITLPDGQVLVIVDGALRPPQFMLGTITIPPANIAALIAGQEPEPAAGAPQSSGGNFVETPGDIGDPFGLGDLLPPTDFGFAGTEDEELIPAAIDNDPEITIITPDQPAGAIAATATVSEAALAARGNEPAGSDPSSTAETVTGTIQIDSPDQPNIVAVNGTAITTVGQTVSTPLGLITITSIAPDAIGYSYTLVDNSTNPDARETVTITVTDGDGDVATATLTLVITDDVPTARADTETVAANLFTAQAGNVITGVGTASGAAGADTLGADGATVTGIRASSASTFTASGTLVQGQYGSLLMLPGGNYSYVRSAGTPGGVADVFTYQLTDGDGDVSTATLTFNIGDSPVGLVVPSAGDEGTQVDEAGLSERDGESAGSRDGDGSNLTFGAISFNTPDGPAIITINGVKVTAVDQEIELPTGTLVIIAINRDSIEYAFVLSDNVSGASGTQPINVTVADQDGDSASASFVIDIFDDTPTAVADSDRVAPGTFGPATGNVITDAENDGGRDIQGADGATVSAVTGAGGSVAPGTAVAGLYGVLTLNADGSYSYARNAGTPGGVSDIFTYTLKDGDGDTSNATLNIMIGDGGMSIIVPSGSDAGQAVSEAGLPGGSAPASGSATTSGAFTISVTDGAGKIFIGGVELTAVGQSFAGTFGTLTITSISPTTIGYSYTLTSPSTGDDNIDDFSLKVVDQDGDQATANLVIAITDDVPTAADDADSLQAGGEQGADGNVLTGAGGIDGNITDGITDIPGADGAAVTSVSFGGNSGFVDGETAGAYGTLTLNGDGSYSYILDNENPDVVGLNGNQSLTEVFEYVITDGDGDESTATLTISIRGKDDIIVITGLNPEGAEATVSEANLPDGTAPDSDALIRTGSFSFNAADGLASLTIGGEALFDGDIVPGLTLATDHGMLTITDFDPLYDSSGEIIGGTIGYSYELTDNLLLHSGASDAALTESFAITITDTDGSVATSSLDVVVIDDLPVARAAPLITVAEDAPAISGNLLANDSAGADGARVTSVNVGGVTVAILPSGTTTYINALGTYTFDAGGAWTFDPVSSSSAASLVADFTYTITDGDGDTSTAQQQIRVVDGANPKAGAPITLTLDDQNLETGSTPAMDQPVSVQGQIQFTPGSDPIVSIIFGDISGLGGGLSWMRISDTQIVGLDVDKPVVLLDLTVTGTTATVVATLESNYAFHPDVDADDLAALGAVNVIATDSDGDQAAGTVDISVSDDVPSITALPPVAGLLAVDESNLAANATANFASLFNVVMGADQPGSASYSFVVSNGSGLVDVATGSPITLHAIDNVVEGRVAGSPGIVAFRLTVTPDGQATLDQIRPVRHGDAINPDDALSIPAPFIQLTATVTDSDGDKASATVNVGGALVFRDDGPSLDVTAADANTLLLTTQDADTRGAAFDVATADLSSAFTVAAANYGADGSNGAAVNWAYALALGTGAVVTGLTSNGVLVTLELVAGEIIGSAGGAPVFTVSVNPATGVVTLTQFAEIDHPLPGSASNYATQLVELPANLIELRGTATIVDRDGDSASDSVVVDMGGNIRFADDGPSVSAGGEGPVLILDESFLAVDVSADLSGLFVSTLDFGADGAGSVAYQLGVTAGPSGLIDSLTGEPVILSIVDGIIYGRTATQEVFRISVAPNGVVSFDQSRAIMHSPDTGPDQTKFLGGTNLITLTAIATDGDGDIAQSTAGITGRFAIKDDAPVAINDADNVARDGQVFADGNVLTGFGGVDENGTDGSPDNAGADGGLLVSGIAFGATTGSLGLALSGEYGSLTLAANGTYRYELDVNDPAVIALNANQMLTDIFSYTVTDADGDTSTATITISITGANDFPIARADTNWVLDGASGSDPSAFGNVLQNINHPGAPSGSFADVADSDPDLEPITVTSAGTIAGLYGTLVIAADGAYTYTLNEDNAAVNALDAGQTLVESFGYTVSDGLLSVGSTLTITVFGTNDAPTIGAATARISEEGLVGGIADTAPNATLDTTNSVSFSGTLAIGDPDAGETLTASLGDPGAVLSAGGVPVTWTGVGTGTLVGSAGGNEVIRVTLAANGAYTVTLSRAVDHPVVALEDLKEFTVPVSASDGTVTTTNASAIRIIIEDDAPTATGETGSSAQVQQDVNTLFVLDFSQSIDDGELDVMLDAVKNALTLLDSSALSALTIKFVIFSSLSFASPSFTNAADANAYLDSLNPADGGTRPDTIGGNTNYTSAIQTALANFSAIPGASNQVFFLSDGNPNQGVQFSPPNPPNLPTIINSLTNVTSAAWNDFVDDNNVNVTVIGIDKDPTGPLQIQRLRDVDLNDAPDNEPILVDEFEDLVATLLSVVVPAAVAGDLDANDAYGADGGRLLSITVGTTTYTWDGLSSIAVSSGGTISGSVLTATTPMGGTLQLNFATGQYNYQPPSPITVTATEVFSYTITDKDGDIATANLSVTITALAPPVVLDLDGDGVEFVSSAAGVLFDYDGDRTAESTAWVGPDDGLLVLDRNGDGKVNNGSEIVFGHDGLTDLQGLAADYDSNGDGKLDSADLAFSRFGIWQDANSNGVTDAGEIRSLADAGIASISLVSDGRSYTAAEGQVIVRGEAVFTRVNGVTGKLADAAFATNFVNDPQRALSPASSGLSTALVAAGLVAAMPLAAEDEDISALDNPLVADTDAAQNGRVVEPSTAERVTDSEFSSGPFDAEDTGRQTGDEPAALRHVDDGGYVHAQKAGWLDMPERGPMAAREEQPDEPMRDVPRHGPLAESGDQVLLLTPEHMETAQPTTDEVREIVADAIEGRSVDLDSLLAAYAGPDQMPSQFLLRDGPNDDMFANRGMAASGDLFMPDMAEQHVLVQLEQMAAAGHA